MTSIALGWLLSAALHGATPAPPSQVPATTPTPATSPAPATRPIDIDGEIATLIDVLPRQDPMTEWRSRLLVDISGRLPRGASFTFDAGVETLVAARDHAAIAHVRDAYIDIAGARGDVRVGFARLVWGRLDEVQPTDVINPIDTASFLFEGRAEARLPVGLVRGRWFAGDRLTIEGVVVPAFRRGRFDRLAESSSPFNLVNDAVGPGVPITRVRPSGGWSGVSGGGRLSATVGRTDLSVSAFRGFDALGVIAIEPAVAGPALVERHPRFTMIGADAETVAGEWAIRGEVAVFVERTMASSTGVGRVPGRLVEGGMGVDRRAGSYRFFGSVIVRRQWSDADAALGRTDTLAVASIERQWSRDRLLTRAFVVANAADRSGFVRALVAWRVRDDVVVEASAAGFPGRGSDNLGRFDDRDFLLGKVRWLF